jgi:hypothetical protein
VVDLTVSSLSGMLAAEIMQGDEQNPLNGECPNFSLSR